VIFVLMGGLPLLGWIAARGESPIVPPVSGTRAGRDVRELRDLRDAMGRAYASAYARAGDRATAAAMTMEQATDPAPTRASSGATSATAMGAGLGSAPTPPADEDLVDGLERLARLHGDGALTDDQFEAAKEALIAAARRG
jgi:hypothetical protein